MARLNLESQFIKTIGDSYKAATPGLKLQAYLRGRKRFDLEFGDVYKFYDLASLTKILFSASLMMRMCDERQMNLTSRIDKVLDWYEKPHTVKNLMSHSAGLVWWKPYYKEINQKLSRSDRYQQLQDIIRSSPIFNDKPEKKAVYSDLDLFIVSFFYTALAEQGLEELWREQKEFYGFEIMDFHIDNKAPHKIKDYAPTEMCSWRGRVMQGEVHDENTWSLGGIAPHAGLFSDMDDLATWGLRLRKTMLGDRARGFASPESVARFTRRAIPREVGDWASGFMMPSREGSSAGKYFSPQSVGHTGFTGTSLWFDPKRDLLVIVLSNRVHPTRENNEIRNLRPRLHDLVVELLEET